MKYLYILLMAVCFCFNSFGQKDTVRCIMICADTVNNRPISNMMQMSTLAIQARDTAPINFYTYPPVYWQFGYEVIKTVHHPQWERNGAAMLFEAYDEKIHEFYLDEKKKLLPKSIIVIQSIPAP